MIDDTETDKEIEWRRARTAKIAAALGKMPLSAEAKAVAFEAATTGSEDAVRHLRDRATEAARILRVRYPHPDDAPVKLDVKL